MFNVCNPDGNEPSIFLILVLVAYPLSTYPGPVAIIVRVCIEFCPVTLTVANPVI